VLVPYLLHAGEPTISPRALVAGFAFLICYTVITFLIALLSGIALGL